MVDIVFVNFIFLCYIILPSRRYVNIKYFSKKLFTEQYKKFVELVDVVTKLMVELHKNYMATSILHDAESNNWADSKEFYEVMY